MEQKTKQPLITWNGAALRALWKYPAAAAVGALLSCGQLLGTLSPLGVAFTAAAGCAGGREDRWLGASAAAGVLLGCILMGSQGMKYAAAVVLCCAAGLIFRDAPVYDQPWFAPACGVLSMLATNTVYIISSAGTASDFALYLCEVLFCGMAALLYRRAVETVLFPRAASAQLGGWRLECAPRKSSIDRAGVFALLVSGCLSLQGVQLFAGLDIGRTLGLILVCLCAGQGAFSGAALGLCIGVALDLSAGQSPQLAALYGLCGLFAGIFSRFGTFQTALAYTVTNAAALMWLDTQQPFSLLYEAFFGSVMYTLAGNRLEVWLNGLLPEPVRLNREFAPRRGHRGDAQLQYLKTQLSDMAAAFLNLSTAMRAPSAAMTEDPARCYIDAVKNVCRRCSLNDQCWVRDYAATRGALNDALPAVTGRRRALPEDFPPYFAARCIHLSEFSEVVSQSLLQEAYRQRYVRRTGDDLQLLEAQFDAVTRALADIADTQPEPDVESVPTQQPLRATVGVGSRRKDGETVCGDALAYFRTPDNLLCLVISDGMGSGPQANRESTLFVDSLRSFLKAGMRPDTALGLLCPAFAIKCAGDSFTTCDLLCLDTETGHATFYKCGAAPSLIRTADGTVKRITSTAPPAGVHIPRHHADVTKLTLGAGDLVVMCSDGVDVQEEETWLAALIADCDPAEPRTVAASILETAAQDGCVDDMTVLALRLR